MKKFAFIGGIDTSSPKDSTIESGEISIEEDSAFQDENAEEIIGITGDNAEGRQEVSDSSNEAERVDRREKISKILKDRKEKNIMSTKSFERLKLSFMREDVEQAEPMDKGFLQHAKKMTTSMERMTEAMTRCMEIMQRMCTMQMHQQSMLLENQNAMNYMLPPSSSPNFSFQQQSLQRNLLNIWTFKAIAFAILVIIFMRKLTVEL